MVAMCSCARKWWPISTHARGHSLSVVIASRRRNRSALYLTAFQMGLRDRELGATPVESEPELDATSFHRRRVSCTQISGRC